MPAVPSSTGLTITNPLVLYRALLATKRIDPDPAQHRLAIHLQKLYDRLKDYEPVVEYSHRLSQISKTLGNSGPRGAGQDVAPPPPSRRGILGSLFEQKPEREALALTRVLTSQEAAMELDSPKGLMLHGEVGTGKSMLIDLFADCLPNRKKKRWHFTTFMLDTMAQLERLRRSRQMVIPTSLGQQDDYSLLWLARNMISTSPILFLDEFQLPDRAASKILTNLLTSFFHLGGVLIATSNRMPEELAKAAGMEFTPPPSRLDSLRWRFGLSGVKAKDMSSGLFSGQGDFAMFLKVLKARCEVWEMNSGKDYRRRELDLETSDAELEKALAELPDASFTGLEPMAPGNVGLGYEQSQPVTDAKPRATAPAIPKHFFVKPSATTPESDIETWTQSYDASLALAIATPTPSTTTSPSTTNANTTTWTSSTLIVYGRHVHVPRQCSGVTAWTFLELCATTLGPADYISLASTYHTIILTDVPILSILQKNEARRFITLLDALYEARCKLLITAEAGPDDLFFPEISTAKTTNANGETVDQDAIQAETFAEAYQDVTAPFRPNISLYDDSAPSRQELDYTHARLTGMMAEDQLEDDPPNRPRHGRPSSSGNSGTIDNGDGSEGYFRRSRFGASGLDDNHTLDQSRSLDERDTHGSRPIGPDFSRSGVFTGEDEQFAYKRARSRLWEMCGTRWWGRAGGVEEWWRPLDRGVRHWEGGEYNPATVAAAVAAVEAAGPVGGGVGGGDVNMKKLGGKGTGEGTSTVREVTEAQDEVMFRHGASPFRVSREPPPKFGDEHVWGVVKWGRRAGLWGQGVEGLEGRRREKGIEGEEVVGKEKGKVVGEDGKGRGKG